MLDTIKARLHFGTLSPAEEADFRRELNFTNYRRYRIFTLVLVPIFIVLPVVDLLNYRNGVWADLNYRTLFCLHSAICVLLLLSVGLLRVRPPRTAGEVTRLHSAVVVFVRIFMMLGLLLVAFVDLRLSGQLNAYVLMTVGIGVVTILPHVESLVFYAICLALLLAGMAQLIEATGTLQSHVINGTVMTIVALVLSRVVYSGYRLNYIHENKIHRQNEDIRAMDEKLRVSELEYHQLFENSPIGV